MKLINPRSLFIGLLGLLTVHLVPAQAQMAQGGAPMPGLDAALLKIFGKDKSFSAVSNMQMVGGGQDIKLKMKLSVRDGNTRSEMDMADIEGAPLPPMVMEQVKKLGMDKITTLLVDGGKTNVIIYPGMNSYLETANPGSGECSISDGDQSEDEIEGVKMMRKDFEVECDGLSTQKFSTWSTRSNDGLPVRLRTEQGGMSVTITLTDVKMEKPDAELFERPEDFQRFSSMAELMAGVQKKMMQQQQQLGQ